MSVYLSSICDRVREAVKDKLSATRYKVVVQATIGQLKDQAIRYVCTDKNSNDTITHFLLSTHYNPPSQSRVEVPVGPHR